MASYFGEVIQSSSRAFWDDEDEDEDEIADICREKVELQVINKSDLPINPSQIELLLIVHGPLIEGMVKACMLHDAFLMAEIIEVKVAGITRPIDPDVPNKKAAPSLIYRKIREAKSSIMICMCSPDLDIKQAYNFTETISPWLKVSKRVVALTCAFGSTYLTDSVNLPTAFLKQLHTDTYKEEALCDHLEPPNIVSGIPAAVLSWCQVFAVPAILYVSYTDSYITDSITVQPLIKLFSELPMQLLKTSKPTFTKRLYDGPESASNLYI